MERQIAPIPEPDSTAEDPTLEPSAGPRPTGAALRWVAGSVALVAAIPLGGLPMLAGGWFSTAHAGTHRIHEIGAGVHMTLVAILLGALLFRSPGRLPAAVQAFAASIVATAVGAIASGDVVAAVASTVIFGVPLAILVAVHPDRPALWRGGAGVSPILGPLVLLGAVPLLRFASDMARLQRDLPTQEAHAADFHWGGMAVLAVVLIAVGIVAALRTAGNRVPAVCAGAGLAVMGIASLAWPHMPSSFGTRWGAVAVLGGVLFGAAAVAEARRPEARWVAPGGC